MRRGRSKIAALLIVAGAVLLTAAGSTPVSADANETATTDTNAGAQASITAGVWHTCALLATGAVNCWGFNGNGRLGDGTEIDRLTPTQVTGLDGEVSEVTAITADGAHTCALLATGAVNCWGANYYGQLGDGTQNGWWTPTQVFEPGSGVTAITASGDRTCALLVTGGVKCWGNNGDGQLGDGTTTDRLTPTQVDGLDSGVTAITAGRHHTCALLVTGGVKCWGNNGDGQLGDGTIINRLTPTQVTGLHSGVGPTTTTEPAATTTGPATTAVPQLPATGGNPTGGLVPFALTMVLIGVSIMAVRRNHL